MYKIIGGDQKEYGPVSADELRRWIREGRLNAQSMVLPEGATEWRALGTFPEFATELRGQTAATPPPVTPVTQPNLDAWRSQITAQPPHVPVFRCLALSWNLLKNNFGLLLGATFIVWLIGTLCVFVPFGNLLYTALRGVLFGGLYLVFLNRIRGLPANVGDTFAGFNIAFVQLMLISLVTAFLTFLGTMCCLLIPGLYLFIAWTFSVPLAVDRRLEFWTAMELSRKIVTRVWFEVFALFLLAFLPSLLMFAFVWVKLMASMLPAIQELSSAGQPDFRHMYSVMMQIVKVSTIWIFAAKFVTLLNLPFAVGALMYAYENLFGTRPTPTT